MSRFYGSLQGQRGDATCQGSTKSGITGHIRGWHSGVEVRGYAEGEDDVFDVYATSGSNGYKPQKFLGTVRLVKGELHWSKAKGA